MGKDAFEQVLEQIRISKLLEPGDVVTAGISGGADSVFLLHVLARLRDCGRISLYAVHVHHGIRGAEADEDARFVEELCASLFVPCHTEYMDIPALAKEEKLTLEEAGRKARYECFRREMIRVGANKLAVAHHRDDCAETILFNLVRGSGIRGLCGIAPVQGQIIRPLLGLRKREIEEALVEGDISWRTDSTNGDVRYTRNRIRRELIPYLENNLNTDAVEHLTSMGELLREIDDHMEREADRFIASEKLGRLSIDRLSAADRALQGYLIRRRLGELGGLKDIGKEHVEAVRGLLGKPAGKRLSLPGGRQVCRDYEELAFFLEAETKEDDMLPVKVSYQEISREKFQKINFDPYTKCFDYDRIKSGLYLRTRKPGDSLAVFSDGRRQSVKDYMINAKVPARLRDRIPLLMCGDDVLWIVGYRASEAFRVTKDTCRFLLVTAEQKTEDERTGDR